MKTSVINITKKSSGYGHWVITVELDNGVELKKTTTDSQAIDSWDEATDRYPHGGMVVLAKSTCRDYESENGVTIDYSLLIVEA